jgi:hypothetical protein
MNRSVLFFIFITVFSGCAHPYKNPYTGMIEKPTARKYYLSRNAIRGTCPDNKIMENYYRKEKDKFYCIGDDESPLIRIGDYKMGIHQ